MKPVFLNIQPVSDPGYEGTVLGSECIAGIIVPVKGIDAGSRLAAPMETSIYIDVINLAVVLDQGGKINFGSKRKVDLGTDHDLLITLKFTHAYS